MKNNVTNVSALMIRPQPHHASSQKWPVPTHRKHEQIVAFLFPVGRLICWVTAGIKGKLELLDRSENPESAAKLAPIDRTAGGLRDTGPMSCMKVARSSDLGWLAIALRPDINPKQVNNH